MRYPGLFACFFDFSELDLQIEKFRALRDSYRAANVAYFGEELANYLDD